MKRRSANEVGARAACARDEERGGVGMSLCEAHFGNIIGSAT